MISLKSNIVRSFLLRHMLISWNIWNLIFKGRALVSKTVVLAKLEDRNLFLVNFFESVNLKWTDVSQFKFRDQLTTDQSHTMDLISWWCYTLH